MKRYITLSIFMLSITCCSSCATIAASADLSSDVCGFLSSYLPASLPEKYEGKGRLVWIWDDGSPLAAFNYISIFNLARDSLRSSTDVMEIGEVSAYLKECYQRIQALVDNFEGQRKTISTFKSKEIDKKKISELISAYQENLLLIQRFYNEAEDWFKALTQSIHILAEDPHFTKVLNFPAQLLNMGKESIQQIEKCDKAIENVLSILRKKKEKISTDSRRKAAAHFTEITEALGIVEQLPALRNSAPIPFNENRRLEDLWMGIKHTLERFFPRNALEKCKLETYSGLSLLAYDSKEIGCAYKEEALETLHYAYCFDKVEALQRAYKPRIPFKKNKDLLEAIKSIYGQALTSISFSGIIIDLLDLPSLLDDPCLPDYIDAKSYALLKGIQPMIKERKQSISKKMCQLDSFLEPFLPKQQATIPVQLLPPSVSLESLTKSPVFDLDTVSISLPKEDSEGLIPIPKKDERKSEAKAMKKILQEQEHDLLQLLFNFSDDQPTEFAALAAAAPKDSPELDRVAEKIPKRLSLLDSIKHGGKVLTQKSILKLFETLKCSVIQNGHALMVYPPKECGKHIEPLLMHIAHGGKIEKPGAISEIRAFLNRCGFFVND